MIFIFLMFSTKIFLARSCLKIIIFSLFLPEISRNNVVMPLFTSFAGQPIHLLVHYKLLSRLSGGSSKERECFPANSC